MTHSPSMQRFLPCVAVLAFLLGGMAPASEPFFIPNQDPKPAGQKWLLVENMSDEEEVQFYLDGKYVYSIKPKVASGRHVGKRPPSGLGVPSVATVLAAPRTGQ